jgi:hypothetical protein
MNKVFKEHFFQLAASLLLIVVSTVVFYYQFTNVRTEAYLKTIFSEKDLLESQKDLQEIQRKLIDVIDQKLAVSKDDLTNLAITSELKKLNIRIDELSNDSLALRQAINPVKPEEILTIARLTDEVKSIRSDFTDLEKSIFEKHREFSGSILRELKSSNDATNLILIVLLPLILNFLYTVWRDLRSERKEEASNKQSQPDA